MMPLSRIQPAFAIQTHADDRLFHLGWLVTTPGEVVGNCPNCGVGQTWGVALMGQTAGDHCTLDQLEEIWRELSAMLFGEERGLLAIGDNMNVGTFWASYVLDPRVLDKVTAWWVGVSGSAFVVDQHDVVMLVDIAGLFIRRIKDYGWASFKAEGEREPVADVYRRAFEDASD